MATDYISREAAIETVISYDFKNCPYYMRDFATNLKSAVCSDICTDIAAISAADVVARDCYDRILAENVVIWDQLAAIREKPGDKDAEWERPSKSTPRSWIFRCNRCKDIAYYPIPKGHVARCGYKYCPNCGADMRQTTKGENT